MPVLGICYGQKTMCVQLGGVAEGSDHREFGRAFVEIDKRRPLFDGLWQPGERHQVWMSHGDRVIALPQGFRGVRPVGRRAVRHLRPTSARVLRAACSIPRWCTRRTARRLLAQLRPQHRRRHRRLDDGAPTAPQAVDADPQPGRRRAGHLRAVGRRRFLGRRGAHPRGDRRAADLHLRRSRPDAQGRGGRGGRRCSAATTTSRWSMSTRRELFLAALDGVDRSREEAQDHRPAVHRGVRGRGEESSAAPDFLAQGTLYPDVIESVSLHAAARRSPSSRTTMSAACRSA